MLYRPSSLFLRSRALVLCHYFIDEKCPRRQRHRRHCHQRSHGDGSPQSSSNTVTFPSRTASRMELSMKCDFLPQLTTPARTGFKSLSLKFWKLTAGPRKLQQFLALKAFSKGVQCSSGACRRGLSADVDQDRTQAVGSWHILRWCRLATILHRLGHVLQAAARERGRASKSSLCGSLCMR